MIRHLRRADVNTSAVVPLAELPVQSLLVAAAAGRRRDEAVLQQARELAARALAHAFPALSVCSPERIEHLVDESLQRVRTAAWIALAIHPEDAGRVADAREYVERLQLCGELRIEHDATLDRGGCLLRCSHGEVDARVQTQLGSLLDLLERGAFDEA